MIHHLVNKWRQILPHGILEQAGVLLWVMSVMVIGLRITLLVPDQPIFVGVLQFSAKSLSVIAALGATMSTFLVALHVLRSSSRSAEFIARPRDAIFIWWNKHNRFMPSLGSLTLFTVDALLAATIVRTALGWAEQSNLSSRQLAYLIGIAALHIALAVVHEHRPRE